MSFLWLKMAENLLHTSSFKRFLKTVGIDSNSTAQRSASLPSKGAKSASTFYSYSSEDLAGCEVPSKCGWLFRQSRGMLRSWQVGHVKNCVFDLVDDSDRSLSCYSVYAFVLRLNFTSFAFC